VIHCKCCQPEEALKPEDMDMQYTPVVDRWGGVRNMKKTYLGQHTDVINLVLPSWIDCSEGLGYRGASSTWTKTPFDTFEGVNSTQSMKEWGRKENREGVTNKLQQKKLM
jgi:hypothetical protein